MTYQTRSLILAAMVAGTLSACAASGDGAQQVAKDPHRIICRTEADTGSRLANRTCKPASEWERIADANVEAIRNLNRETVEGPPAVERSRAR